MRRRHRPTLAELRGSILLAPDVPAGEIIHAVDDMHDRLRDEVLRALRETTNRCNREGLRGSKPLHSGVHQSKLVVEHWEADKALRAVFDRRKRKARR